MVLPCRLLLLPYCSSLVTVHIPTPRRRHHPLLPSCSVAHRLRQHQAQVAADIRDHYAAKQRIVGDAVAPSLAAAKAGTGSSAAAQPADTIPARRSRRPSSSSGAPQQQQQAQEEEPLGTLGLGLPEMDRSELAKQRRAQDESLDHIGAAMDALKVMATGA